MSDVLVPSGDVTLMFTDIEGSTKGWDTYRETFRAALEIHDRLIREAIALDNGYEVKTIGDSFMVAFSDAARAAHCALELQRRIESGPFAAVGGIRVRVGLHSGMLEPHFGDYFGPTVNHAARISSAGHGGQIAISEETAIRIRDMMAPGARLSDEGMHRLKDLGAPIRLFLLTHDDLPKRDYPPLRTLNMFPHNFPAQVTSFVGREREQAELRSLIAEKDVRLVTLTGPGGTGKTRLSMQVAAEAVHKFQDGIWLIELAGLTDAREVPAAVALALKIPIVGDSGIAAQVFAYAKEKKALLVIDNFEQVVEAAQFVGDLLKQCRGIACLITSQHLLQISGELEYALPPLDLPASGASLDDCFRNATVQLFAERARAARPAFTLNDEQLSDVVEICRRLEGLPLAVELTAALVRALTPQQILPRLKDRYKLLASTRRDLDPRQRSLRGALDWSYDLLTEEERSFFTQLSVFSGGFFLDDVEAVFPDVDAFFLVVALRDKSLLRAEEVDGETRYLLMETLRGYAAEKLERTGEASAIRERHAQHFLEHAQKWSAALNSSGEAMQRMIREIDNLRSGMDWASEQAHDVTVIAYGLAMGRFYTARGLYEEGERRLVDAEECARRTNDLRALAQLLLMRGRIADHSGGLPAARSLYLESYGISEGLGDYGRLVPVLGNLGGVDYRDGDMAHARQNWELALQFARDTKQPAYEASLLSNLALIPYEDGRFDEALAYLNLGLELHRQQNNQKGLAYALRNCADTLDRMGDFPTALRYLQEARGIFKEIGDRYGTARALVHSSDTLFKAGDDASALTLANEGLQLALELHDDENVMLARILLARFGISKGALAETWVHYGEAAAIALQRRDTRKTVDLISLYARFLEERGETGEALALTTVMDDPDVQRNADRLSKVLEAIIEQIGH